MTHAAAAIFTHGGTIHRVASISEFEKVCVVTIERRLGRHVDVEGNGAAGSSKAFEKEQLRLHKTRNDKFDIRDLGFKVFPAWGLCQEWASAAPGIAASVGSEKPQRGQKRYPTRSGKWHPGQ